MLLRRRSDVSDAGRGELRADRRNALSAVSLLRLPRRDCCRLQDYLDGTPRGQRAAISVSRCGVGCSRTRAVPCTGDDERTRTNPVGKAELIGSARSRGVADDLRRLCEATGHSGGRRGRPAAAWISSTRRISPRRPAARRPDESGRTQARTAAAIHALATPPASCRRHSVPCSPPGSGPFPRRRHTAECSVLIHQPFADRHGQARHIPQRTQRFPTENFSRDVVNQEAAHAAVSRRQQMSSLPAERPRTPHRAVSRRTGEEGISPRSRLTSATMSGTRTPYHRTSTSRTATRHPTVLAGWVSPPTSPGARAGCCVLSPMGVLPRGGVSFSIEDVLFLRVGVCPRDGCLSGMGVLSPGWVSLSGWLSCPGWLSSTASVPDGCPVRDGVLSGWLSQRHWWGGCGRGRGDASPIASAKADFRGRRRGVRIDSWRAGGAEAPRAGERQAGLGGTPDLVRASHTGGAAAAEVVRDALRLLR